jgi:hypothetical protein
MEKISYTKEVCPSCIGINGIHFEHCNAPRGLYVATNSSEVDPNGISAKAHGSKLDAGKTEMSLIFEGFPRALLEVGKVATFGASKYTRGGWQGVADGIYRYKNAAGRHYMYRLLEGDLDKDSGLLHEAHELWNHLASFELKLRGRE